MDTSDTFSDTIIFVIKSILGLILMSMLFSCENDINTINSLSQVDSLPVDEAKDIELYYSENGHVQAYLESPLMIKQESNDSYYEFPKGFKVIFYDSLMNETSQITANYGIRYEKKKIMEAKNKVVVINIAKDEKLETEHLVWDEPKRTIYSDVFVKITRPDEVIYGKGLTSDQDFTKYEIKNVSGEFQINPDEQ